MAILVQERKTCRPISASACPIESPVLTLDSLHKRLGVYVDLPVRVIRVTVPTVNSLRDMAVPIGNALRAIPRVCASIRFTGRSKKRPAVRFPAREQN